MSEEFEPTGVGASVQERDRKQNPAGYAARYQFSMDHNAIVPAIASDTKLPPVFKRVQFTRGEDGEFEAFVPTLATGTIGFSPGGVGAEWNTDSFGNFTQWDLMPAHRDGKDQMRKGLRWWLKDPVVYKCVKVLCQLANTEMTFTCEDDAARAVVENWFKKTMPVSFRKAWFMEYYRSSMVPVLRMKVPYKPSAFNPNKTPKVDMTMVRANELSEEDREELAKAEAAQREQNAANEKATLELIEKQRLATENFTQAYAEWNKANEMHKIGLCSAERLAKHEAAKAAAEEGYNAGQVPGGYTILNPLTIEIRGPFDMPWLREPYLWIGQDMRNCTMDPTDHQKNILSKLPTEITTQVKNGGDRIHMPPSIFSMAFGEKQPYEKYPTPIACHAEDALRMKYLLLQMDEITAKSLRDRILKVTIGNDEYLADDAQLQNLAAMFNAPSRNLTLFWNHTLSIEWIEPINATFQDINKYQIWNEEIRTAFGISTVLTGTSDKTGAIGNSMLNLSGVKEEVEEGQQAFLEWFNHELDIFRQAIGLKTQVVPEFDRMNLEDEAAMGAMLQQWVMNGLIDHQTALETMKFHFPTVKARMKTIKKLQADGKGIFLPTPSANNLGPGADAKLAAKQGKTGAPNGGTPTGGKPKGKPGKSNQQKKGKSQPKNGTKKPASAKAKLIPGDDGISAYLVVGRDMNAEDREMISEKFAIPAQYVLTEAEYTKATGKQVSWLSTLPPLDMGDMIKIMTEANTLAGEAAQKAQAEIDQHRAAGDGKRGKYATAKFKAEVNDRVLEEVMSGHLPEMQPEELTERLALASQEAAGCAYAKATDQQKIISCLMLREQFAKRELMRRQAA